MKDNVYLIKKDKS